MTRSKLLAKEITALERSLYLAKRKRNATNQEISNIEQKLTLKKEILHIVREHEKQNED